MSMKFVVATLFIGVPILVVAVITMEIVERHNTCVEQIDNIRILAEADRLMLKSLRDTHWIIRKEP